MMKTTQVPEKRLPTVVPLLAAMCFGLLMPAFASAADATQPHRHRGVVKPYEGAPPQVPLTDVEIAQLDKGAAVRKQVDLGDGGRGVAVFRVDAPVDVVWTVISDFPSYPRWISSLKECEVYRREGEEIDVRFKIRSFGISVEYFVRHHYAVDQGWGTWTLDYDRSSDLDDSVGFWRVTPVAGQPGRSQVEYSVDVRIKGWFPKFVRNMVVDKGLEEATEWVKIQSEKRAKSKAVIASKPMG